MQERGIKYHDEKYLSNRTIFKLLHKLKYTGKVEHGGIVYDKVYPQIISDELWRKVEMIHQQNKIAPSSKKQFMSIYSPVNWYAVFVKRK